MAVYIDEDSSPIDAGNIYVHARLKIVKEKR
jgi:hypothetical protein